MAYIQLDTKSAKIRRQQAKEAFNNLESRKTTPHDVAMVKKFLASLEENPVLKIVRLNQGRLSDRQLKDSIKRNTNFLVEYGNIITIAMILFLCKDIKKYLYKEDYTRVVKFIKIIDNHLDRGDVIKMIDQKPVMISQVFSRI